MKVFRQILNILWKQLLVDKRKDMTTIIAAILLPSILMLLSATNSGLASTSDINSIKIEECKVDSFFYCNYPIQPIFFANKTNVVMDLEEAASNVAEQLGLTYDTLFSMNATFPNKYGGQMVLVNETYGSLIWYSQDENTKFSDLIIGSLNSELELLNSTLRFEYKENPFRYEGNQGFDLRIASFFLILQAVGQRVTTDKTTNMYFYLTRVGLLPSVYWFCQYICFTLIASLSIAVTLVVAKLSERTINIGGYFVSAWFHVTFGVMLGTIFKNKAYVNNVTTLLIILSFIIPAIFEFALPKTDLIQNIYQGIKMIPIFLTSENVDGESVRVGSIITIFLMVIASYLAPLISVFDGTFESGVRNYLYFLSPKFWTEGIVALPSHKQETSELASSNDDTRNAHTDEENLNQILTLKFQNCEKNFRNATTEKSNRVCNQKLDTIKIGPIDLTLEIGKINTLLGKNGVGKSTFLKVAAGYYIPSGGEVFFEEKNIFRSSLSSLQHISLCPQDNYLCPDMTIDEHLRLITQLRDISHIEDISSHINWILTTLSILDKRATIASNLSGGMKRRLCLAMAVVGFPKVLLLDEPSSGVDSINQRGIWKLLETTKKHSAILLTTHSALEAVILSDTVINMSSSIDISLSSGYKKTSFELKNMTDNSFKKYSIPSLDLLEEVISSLSNDGTEWRISSKTLSEEALLSLSDAIDTKEIANTMEESDKVQPNLQLQTHFPSNHSSVIRQASTLVGLSRRYPDRMGFLIVMGIPISVGFIWFATIFAGLRRTALLMPLIPIIYIIPESILLSNAAVILATERELGVSKLLFSLGISRKAYLLSFIFYYAFMSIPIPFASLIYVGSVHGTILSTFALIVLFLSFWILHIGLSMFLGSNLDPRTAFISTCVLPSVFSIVGQGSLNRTFSNSYPGSTGQVFAGLMINDLSNSEWKLYAMSLVVNVILGFVGLYLFLTKFENHNPIKSNIFQWKKRDKIRNPINDLEADHMDTNTGALLEGQNIDKIYGVGMKDSSSFKALNNVSFSVSEGSLVGLVGKSGAGKSTLMDILSGQISSTEGSIFVDGKKVSASKISRVVSLCSQLDTIWPDMSVLNAIKVFMKCRGYGSKSYTSKAIVDPYIVHIIEALGMQEMLKKAVKKLSGGQKRRLAFLASLLGETKVILVDEAMTGVDVETRQIMWKILQNEVTQRNRSVVVTTHDIREVEQYCNTVGILHRGTLVEMGPLKEIQKKWSDNVKLTCLVNSDAMLREVEDLLSSQTDFVMGHPLIDILDDFESSPTNVEGKIIATYPIDLVNIKNISKIIEMMENFDKCSGEPESRMLFWSIEPMSLDDFIASSNFSSTNASIPCAES